MQKPRIKIYFEDFWPNFEKNDNFFTKILSKKYEVIITNENPEILFYSVFGIKHLSYKCKKVFYTGENVRPNFRECDFSFSFDYPHDEKNYRLPLYPIFGDPKELVKAKPKSEEILAAKTKFCNFIYSNPANPVRNEFFKKLNKYKKVDSGGRLFNNMNERIEDKLEFIKDYKFTIAFENESFPGYQTEKLFEPMLVHSLPIYWGNTLADRDFNVKSFIFSHSFKDLDALVEHIIEVDQNDELYLQYMKEPYFVGNEINEFVKEENILKRFSDIIDSDITPIGSTLNYNSSNKLKSSICRAKTNLLYKIKNLTGKIKRFSLLKLQVKLKKMFGN